MKTWLWQENDVIVIKPLSEIEVQVLIDVLELTAEFDPVFPKNISEVLDCMKHI